MKIKSQSGSIITETENNFLINIEKNLNILLLILLLIRVCNVISVNRLEIK